MATEVKLPELGDGIESGDVLEIFVSVGDVVTAGQDVVELETDKATVPVPTSVAGKVTKIVVAEGDTVSVGAVLLEIEASQSVAAAATSPESTPSESTPSETKASPRKAVAAKASETIATPPAPSAPSNPVSTPSVTPTPEPTAAATSPGVDSGEIPAGPAVRRFAREVGVHLADVAGSGDGGRITREDILAVVRSTSQSNQAQVASPTTPAGTLPSTSGNLPGADIDLPGDARTDDFGSVRVERMSKIRKTIAAHMHTSWSTVPRVTNFDDADITDLENLRQSSKEDYAAQGLKLTTMPFLIKAVATALKHHPSINAVLDEQNQEIIYKDYVNVGIAVDTDRGLVVPVMREVDRMGVPEVTRSLAEMAGKVRGGSFGLSDLKGGTFTISNLGAIGGQYSTPIVNVPEVAILLVGRSRKLPVVMPDDSIQPRLMMPLSLSYDHRLVDGGTAARFLNDVIGYLEAPSRLLLAL